MTDDVYFLLEQPIMWLNIVETPILMQLGDPIFGISHIWLAKDVYKWLHVTITNSLDLSVVMNALRLYQVPGNLVP